MAYKPTQREAPADTIRRVCAEQLRKGARELASARAIPPGGPSSVSMATTTASRAELMQAVHKARVRLKRARALLSLVRGPMGDERDAENDRLRSIAKSLEGPRDAQSMVEIVDTLRDDSGPGPTPVLDAVLAEWKRRSREALSEGLEDAVIGEAIARLDEAAARAERWRIPGEGFGVLRDGLKHQYAKVRKGRREALASDDIGARHAWRSDVKRLSEQMRLLRWYWPASLRPERRTLRDIASALGDDHDLSLLAGALRTRPADFGTPDDVLTLADLADEKAAAIVRTQRRPARRVLVEKPGAFVRRIEGLWRAWRAWRA